MKEKIRFSTVSVFLIATTLLLPGIPVFENNLDKKAWQVSMASTFPNGEVISEKANFEDAEITQYKNSVNRFPSLFTEKSIGPNGAELRLACASLIVPKGALKATQDFSITALRDKDLAALSQGMVNVSRSHQGYRFLPHGDHFKIPASIVIGYDENKLPKGYTADDIRTFYFDEITKKWAPLQRDSVDVVNKEVVSLTTHFTDMINGVIRVPESPQTQAYHPNSINDIQAANPSTGIFTMPSPDANSMGSAFFSYPINVPAGRLGMQPHLAIQYNNEGGNGWLGMGWDLHTPSIGIETRWGVPRYDSDWETETYTMDGDQLSPITYRNDSIVRSKDKPKRFYHRVEGSFDRIIRYGDSTSNYWWEVTDKSGTRYSYGGEAGDKLDTSAVLTDEDVQNKIGNIGYWALKEVRDLNGNFVLYEYSKIRDAGVKGSNVMGTQLYCKQITYTGFGNTPGKYTVTFIRDSDLPDSLKFNRIDIEINARLGFKQVTADLLRKIEIQYNGEPIRSYALNYRQGAFFKTLLENITEYDAEGKAFNSHDFDYFDDVRDEDGNYQPLGDSERWNTKNDNIRGDFLINNIPGFNDKASALSGTKSSGFEVGAAVTAGPNDLILTAKTSTAGTNYSYSQTNSEGMLALVDINGDNLPDKVFKYKNNLQYRANQSGPNGSVDFSGERPISGIQDFSKGQSMTNTVGIEANGPAVAPVFAGSQFAFESNETTVYFSDVNGDGLTDIVNKGTVYFNRLENGNPQFDPSSKGTPSPITYSSGIDSTMVQQDSAALEVAIEQNPLQDLVRIWIAPFDGTISITGQVQLIENTSPERADYDSADGVRVAIQHENTELWSARIDASDYSSKTPDHVSSVKVKKGNHIYFRVQSVYDGLYDQVHWTPVITYKGYDHTIKDANDLPVYQYKSKDDFLLSAQMSTGLFFDGKIHIEGNFTKPVTTDTVHAKIVKIDSTGKIQKTLWQEYFPWDSLVNLAISIDDTVSSGDNFFFNVSSATNIDWSALSWMPKLYYTASYDSLVTQVIDTSTGNYIYQFYPGVYYQTFDQTLQRSLPWTYDGGQDSVTVKPNLALKPNSKESGTVVFSIKKKSALISKDSIVVDKGLILNSPPASKVDVTDGHQLYFEYFTTNSKLAGSIEVANTSVQDTTATAGLYAVVDTTSIFGAMYRYWGQFVYNGNPTLDTQPIIQSKLVLNSSINNDTIDLSGADTPRQMDSLYNAQGGYYANQDTFVYMMVNMQEQAWKGYDYLTYLKKDTVSSSRMGNKNPSGLNPIVKGNSTKKGARGIVKISSAYTTNLSAGIVFGACYSNGNSTFMYDFMDMNGDRYPDILSKNKIQYTLPTGGLSLSATSNDLGEVSKSRHHSLGLTLGGTFLESSAQNSPSKSGGSKSSDAQAQAEISLGISFDYNHNEDETDYAWMDINGDDLPDRVHNSGKVQLNLGYKFAEKEEWSFGGASSGNAKSFGAGLGINLFNNSFSAGTGLSRTDNDTRILLQDMNGDGLLDFVVGKSEIHHNSPLIVAINTGNGFADTIHWKGANIVSTTTSTGESTNAAFTACVPLVFPFLVTKLCTNPMSNVSNGVNRDNINIADIDGDGYPDYLASSEDSQLIVKRSTIHRTNLLKSVSRPFGVEIELSYERMGNNYDLPNSKWVLASTKMNDGFEGDGADTIFTTFKYKGGRYDRNEREFYGFDTITTTQYDTEKNNTPYRVITHEYNNDNYYEKGLLLSEVITDSAGNKYTETINSYKLKNLEGRVIPDILLENYDKAAFPALSEVYRYFYEGHPSAQKSTHFNYHYDTLGNVINYVDYGDTGPEDDLFADIEYYYVRENYIAGTPKFIIVQDINGDTLRMRNAKIDRLTGDVKQIIQWADPNTASTYNMEYYHDGNLKHIEFPPNDSSQRMFYRYEYDDDVSTYITKIEDAYGYSSSAAYDLRFGTILTSTDLNNNSTHFKLDAIGRTDTIIGPLELKNDLPYTITFEYHPEDTVPWALTKHYDPQYPDNPLETVTFIDGLERVIQVKKDGSLFTGAGESDQEVMIVSGRLSFDAFGRTTEQYYPVTENTGNQGNFNYSYDSISPTITTYDILNRLLTDTLPDTTFTTYEYDFGKDRDSLIQFSTLITDANGIQTETYTNVRGLRTSVRDLRKVKRDIWTSYDYNAINELTTVTDDQGNKTVSTYDWLGRRDSILQPDAGLTTLKFDRASNLVEKITANLQTDGVGIKYVYDFDRLSEINYPKNPGNNVHYTYGESRAPGNRAGRVVVQEDASGSQEFSYNELGALVKNNRSIILPLDTLLYTTEWTYDTWNRLTDMVYPDGETLTYTYNTGGLLQDMTGNKEDIVYNYVTQLGFDKFEQRVYLGYGNGTETTYAYEPERRRLSHLTTETAKNRKIMDNTYTYDNTINILTMVNNAPVPKPNLMGGSASYRYEYDDLYRLTHAKGSFTGSNHTDRYQMDMQYNSTYSIVNKAQLHDRKANNPNAKWVEQKSTTYDFLYKYDPQKQPHAPIHIGDKTYTYDANGNQKGWTADDSGQRRTIVWDEENRIQSISDNGVTNNYVYDAYGERVLKNRGKRKGQTSIKQRNTEKGGLGNYTVYVNPYYVDSSPNTSKHFFVGGSRMVTKLVSDNNNGKGKGNNNEKTEDNQYYYHADNLGSSNYITDVSGEVFQHLEYFAYGETFVEEKSNSNYTPYLFNGKELDDETGLYYYGARYYDPVTSVWESVDPLAEKYPGISPYAYTANNPVNYMDPDGRELYVDPALGAKHIATLQATLQELTHKEVKIKEKNGKLKVSLGKTDKSLERRPIGTKLLKKVIDNSKENMIQFGIEHATKHKKEWQWHNRLRGRKAKIEFAPEHKPEVVTEGGLESVPLHISLGHELIHVDHINRGIFSKRDADYTFRQGQEIKQGRTELEELRTVGLKRKRWWRNITENDLRREHRINKRKAYNHEKDPGNYEKNRNK